MEEERRQGGRRERSRPSKAAFTPPEEDPAPAPPPRRPPASGPAPSVLFQAPEVPDEAPDEPPRRARPAKRPSTDAPAAGSQAREQPTKRTTPGSPAAEPPAQTRPAKRTTADAPARERPRRTTPDATAGETARESGPTADKPTRERPAKRTAPGTAASEPAIQSGPTADAPAGERPAERTASDATAGQEGAPAGTGATNDPAADEQPQDRPAKRAARKEQAAALPGDEGEAATAGTKAAKKATAKKTAAKKAAKKAVKAPAPPAVTAGASPRAAVALVGGPVVGRTKAGDGPAITPRLLDRPGHAPELLALGAVRAIGPRARDWAAQTRATYPAATDDGLARLATQRFVRMAGVGGAVSTALGLLTPVAELTTTAWAEAALVLHLAAVYRRDPLNAERAVDLLVLVGVHPSPEAARAALAEATAEDVEVDGPPALRAAEAAWRLAMPLSAQSRGWLAVRMVARRLVPGVVPVTAAVGAAAAVERLAYRARAHYRAA